MARLAKPALNQAIAIVQKYQDQALSWINTERADEDAPPLDPIQEFHKGPKARTAFPWMTVAYGGTEFSESSELTREQHFRITVQLEVANFDSEFAQDAAIDYMRTLDYLFSSLAGPPPSFQDWETSLPIDHETVPSGTTTPFATGSVKQIFIEREEQSLVLRPDYGDVPVIQVSLTIRFDIEEAF